MSDFNNQDFVDALRQAETHLHEACPPSQEHKSQLHDILLQRVQQNAPRSTPLPNARPILSWAGAGFALAIISTVALMYTRDTPAPLPTTHTAMGLTSTCSLRGANTHQAQLSPGCQATWLSGNATLQAKTLTSLGQRDDTIVVHHGEVSFDINPDRPAPQTIQIRISGGMIEVLGTKFTIIEQGTRGSVTLHRGSIRVIPTHGTPLTLTPGQTHSWEPPAPMLAAPAPPSPEPPAPVSPAPTPEKKPPSPVKQPPKKPREHVSAEELGALRELRRLKRYDDALSNLRRLRRRNLDTSTQEILSFEYGEVLELRGKKACKHWKRHQRRWKRGTYRAEVRARLQRCSR